MNIQADNREDYFTQTGEREKALRRVDTVIQTAAPALTPVLFAGMGGGAVLGYGLQPYQTKSMKQPTEWPLIVLANQKNYMALYICAVDTDGRYFAEKYADQLGNVDCGRSCIRFKRLEDLNLPVVREVIGELARRVADGEKLFGV
ncbi:MAG TPA: DUF1801 domain-containing protein [Candidatus Saccharimonadales bacterium]|nr:DUF1801 domain-containing protein [Candidatus Saccharimonadales bacterium]